MREMLTQMGAVDRCVTEFVRVTNTKLPSRVFYRYCPELHNEGSTSTGIPVYIQLLGGIPEAMAVNARKASSLGARGIDLNFGCPAKLVNRNDGGSVLLKEPQRIHNIVSAVRAAVPLEVPVTAKIRLGYEDRSQLKDICQAVFEANATELAIHARTKVDGYKPPAYWDAIAEIAAISPIPIVANGEIWSIEDYQNCVAQSACSDIMLGRGILSRPDLARQIRQLLQGEEIEQLSWLELLPLIHHFCTVTEEAYESKYVGNRVKQWLGYLRLQYAQAEELFQQVKRLRQPGEIALVIEHQRQTLSQLAAA